MPGSAPEGKTEAREKLRELSPASILDVGPGMGTWHSVLASTFPKAQWTAIEIWGPYVGRYGLKEIYDRVIVADAATVPLADLDSYDLAIFGDVVEHMPATTAREMVSRLPWQWALISLPIIEYPQGECEGNPYEAHLATWSHPGVLAAFPEICWSWTGSELGVYLLARD